MIAKRILICLHDFSRGGTERIAIGLAADWAEAGRDVTILCGNEHGGLRATVDSRVTVVSLTPPIARGFLSRWRLGTAMARHLGVLDPQVIFLPGNFHIFVAAALRRADKRAVIALKISNPPLPEGLAGAAGRLLFRRFTRSIDGFAALTGELAREVAAMVPGKAVTTLRDPVYLLGPPAERAAPDGTRRILWAGRLEPQKDIGLALKTMLELDPSAHLTILGDGGMRNDVDAMIARLGLSQCVSRIGHVPSIDPYLARTDVLLITSRYEGGPAVLVEALAHGVPIVSTDCTPLLREVMTIPEAGRIVAGRDPKALAKALCEVCDAPRPPRQTLAALVTPFEHRHCAAAYLDWFDGLVKARDG